MAVTKNQPTVEYNTFLGLRTVDPESDVGFRGLVQADNVDISRRLKVSRRPGMTRVYQEGSIISGLILDVCTLFTVGTRLMCFRDGASSPTLVRSDMTMTNRLVGFDVGGDVYYSNGFETGVILKGGGTLPKIGVEPPSTPSITRIDGDLPAGTYQVLLSHIRNDGHESGTSLSSTLVLSSTGGLRCQTPTSRDSNVTRTKVFITHRDGDVFYEYGVIPVGGSFSYIRESGDLHVVARNQYYRPPPPFTAIDFHAASVLYSSGDTLYYSIPFGFELVDYRYNHIRLDSEIRMIGVVIDGIYVATADKTYFISGRSIAESSIEVVLEYGAIHGTRSYVSGGLVDVGVEDSRGASKETEEVLPMWVSKQGICVGNSGGNIVNLTQKSVRIPTGVGGTSFFREQDGQNHFVGIINK